MGITFGVNVNHSGQLIRNIFGTANQYRPIANQQQACAHNLKSENFLKMKIELELKLFISELNKNWN